MTWSPAGGFGARTREERIKLLLFYIAVPVGLGIVFGWLQAGRTAGWPKSLAVLSWVGVNLLSFVMSDIGARIGRWLLGRRRVPLWLLLVVTSQLVGFFVYGLAARWIGWVQTWVPAEIPVQPLPRITLFGWIDDSIAGLCFWVLINYFFLYVVRLPRYGYEPPTPAGTPSSTIASVQPAVALAFMDKVRAARRGRLLALKAEGHYLKVFTTAGNDLIHYRFSEAVREAASLTGAQVHRSWWVASDAVEKAGEDSVTLANGIDVPVSRSYRVLARNAGITRRAN